MRKRPLISTAGTLPTLPNFFTGFSLDAKDGLSLWKNGVLQARYSSSGGAGVIPAFSGYQPVDSTHNAILRFELPPSIVSVINGARLSFSLKPFRATQQATSAASSASTTTGSAHQHNLYVGKDATLNTPLYVNLAVASHIGKLVGLDDDTGLTDSDYPAHTHNMSHTHNINAPNGLFDSTTAQGAHVLIDGTDRTAALGGPWGVGSAIDVSDVDISAFITTTGWHEIQVSSTTLGAIIAQVLVKCQLNTAS